VYDQISIYCFKKILFRQKPWKMNKNTNINYLAKTLFLLF